MNILITGAAGYIGSNLITKLAKDANVKNIIAVDNFYSTPQSIFSSTQKLLKRYKNFNFYKLDFYDLENMVPLLERTDVLVHLAEEKEKHIPLQSLIVTNEKIIKWQKNVEGYRRLLEATIVCGVRRVILCSWGGLYVNIKNNKINENQALVPVNHYYQQKIAQEYYNKLFAWEYLLDTLTLRLSNVYGVGFARNRWSMMKERGVIASMVESAVKDKKIVVHDEGLQKRNFLYIKDAVDALEKAIFFKGKCKGEILNICSDDETRIIDIAQYISKICKAKIIHENTKWQENITQYNISNIKAKKKIKFHPSSNMENRIEEFVKVIKKIAGKK